MLMVGFHGLEAPDHVLRWLAEGRINGVILFARNVESPAQLAALTAQCHQAAGRPIFISIDQEGGTVARLRDGFTESPGAMALGAAQSEALAEATAHILAAELRALGINWNYAPVVDITHDINNPSVGARSVGSDPDQVARLGAAQARGFQAGGVIATAKHFPGIGRTPIDTHEALAVISGSLEAVRAVDLLPFRAALDAGAASVMVSHVKFEALDDQHPATLSPALVDGLLRRDLGYDGVVTTDCMEMRAVTDHYGVGESAALAALAGIDMILFSHTREFQEAAFDALLMAAESGRLPEARIDQSVARLDALSARFAITGPPDLSRVRAEAGLAVMREAARAGLVMLRPNPALVPLPADRRIALIEFASILESGVMERGGQTGLAAVLSRRAPEIEAVALLSVDPHPDHLARAEAAIAEAEIIVLATRNAHLIPPQAERARDFWALAAGKPIVLLCLRNPYDAELFPDAGAILCTCGDSAPSLQAAVDALLGAFVPAGRLPVKVNLT
jgi:beta-N-acetylhexosaminidase